MANTRLTGPRVAALYPAGDTALPGPAQAGPAGADPCAKIRNEVRALNVKVADLRGQMEGATGSVLHGLAGKLNLALKQLGQA